jgi:hypothetical protein
MPEHTGLIRLAPDVLFQDLESEVVFLNMNNDRYYGLDEIGTFMWRLLTEHDDIEQVIKLAIREFDTDEATVRRDITRLIEQLTQANIAVTV